MDEMDMGGAPDDEMDKQEEDMSDGGDLDDLDGKQEYVRKEFFARPYESNTGVQEEVQNAIV
jgi:hypothetical protein